MTNLFTPFANSFETDVDASGRFHMQLNDHDYAQIPDKGDWGPVIVTDQRTGKRYRVRGAPCEMDCFCAAEIIEVIERWN